MKGLKREKGEHYKTDTCWYQRAILLERFDCFINKLHGLLSLSPFFWRLKEWIKELNSFSAAFHAQISKCVSSYLMLRCQVYYEPYFKTSLKCRKEGSELDPIKLDVPLQRILLFIFWLFIFLYCCTITTRYCLKLQLKLAYWENTIYQSGHCSFNI